MTEACNIYRVFNPVGPRQRGRAFKWDSAFDPARRCESLRSQPWDRGGRELAGIQAGTDEHPWTWWIPPPTFSLSIGSLNTLASITKKEAEAMRREVHATSKRPARTRKNKTAGVGHHRVTADVTVIKTVTKKETPDWLFSLDDASAFPQPELCQGLELTPRY